MTDQPDEFDWETGTWEGNRKAQLRAALRLTVRQRLESLASLAEISRHFARMRGAGGFHYGDETMEKRPGVPEAVREPGPDYMMAPGTGRYRLHLYGCTPTPLASYLKALAILRLVAEQRDEEAKGWWEGEHFVLESVLDEKGLKSFFLDEYRPTPVIAPWNGGSGFYFREEKQKDPATGKNIKTGRRNQATTATKTIDKLLLGKADRLSELRECARISKSILDQLSIEESPKEGDQKRQLLNRLRAELPDSGLSSLDSSILISSDNLKFPPLLGTGGTDGNLDFTNNFIQRLFDIVDGHDGKPATVASGLLKDALFGEAYQGLAKGAIGQFSPGQSGGPNAGTGYEANSLVNPWDFVFMIEGALLFAAAASRRLGSEEQGALAFPFAARPKGSGQGGLNLADETLARAEMWLPLWERPTSLIALKGLLSEGRVTLGRHGVKDGLDFARAISLLAVNRGINSFQRFAFLKRSGKNYLATPLTRFRVPREPHQDLVSELDRWARRFGDWASGDHTPARVKSLAHRLDNTLFDLIRQRDSRPGTVQKVLILLGEIQRYAGSSPATQEKVPPVPVLSERWFTAARDNSVEFRIAAALAGLQGSREQSLPMRAHLSPVAIDQKYPDWLPDGARNLYRTWHHGSLVRNLAAVLEKRLLLLQKERFIDTPLDGWPGSDLTSIAAFLSGETDDSRVADLLAGLAHCTAPRHIEWESANDFCVIPAAFALLKLVLTPDRQLRRCGLLAENERLPVPAGLVRLLVTDRVEDAVRLAQRRLRIAGISVLPGSPGCAGLDGPRLAATLLIPLTDRSIQYLHRTVYREESRQAS